MHQYLPQVLTDYLPLFVAGWFVGLSAALHTEQISTKFGWRMCLSTAWTPLTVGVSLDKRTVPVLFSLRWMDLDFKNQAS